MQDFTTNRFKLLLKVLRENKYCFLPLYELVTAPGLYSKYQKIIILRHDVEENYSNALKIAHIEYKLGIKGSYYFRLSPHQNVNTFIEKIAQLGHEIGYHYDDFSVCKGNAKEAISRFLGNLAYLNHFGPIETISMEGAPLSKYDNRDLWKIPLNHELINFILNDNSLPPSLRTLFYENVRSSNLKTLHYNLFNIKAEPYFDLDFAKFFYLTDTGRCWNGFKYSVRDKIPQYQEWIRKGYVYHSTNDIIKAVNNHKFPPRAMITIHPQRWHDKPLPWIKELIGQNIKNTIKYFIVLINNFSGSN
ncbi:MAG: hypothetical protein HPY80_13240 [Bacteroidales bacterium]|nr:hypothetical protein [Bacteroidales bacterium]